MSRRFGFPEEDGLQAATLAVFTVFSASREDWGGALIVSVGLGELGSVVALAANIAGAACLSIEPDPAVCRAAMRAGACDFLVNTVDESLRVLKNEIRQRKPLSVALELGTAAALGELLERGVLPQVFASTREIEEASALAAARAYAAQGAWIVDLDETLDDVAGRAHAQTLLSAALEQRGGAPQSFSFPDSAALRSFDARLLEQARNGPERRWAAAAPRLFHRERPFRRVALMTDAEAERLRSAQAKL